MPIGNLTGMTEEERASSLRMDRTRAHRGNEPNGAHPDRGYPRRASCTSASDPGR